MERADLKLSVAHDSSTRVALLLKLTLEESEAKLQELLAVKQTAALVLEGGHAVDDSGTTVTVVPAAKYLGLLQERRLLKEEQAHLKCLQELLRAKEKAGSSDSHKSAEVQLVAKEAQPRVFTWE